MGASTSVVIAIPSQHCSGPFSTKRLVAYASRTVVSIAVGVPEVEASQSVCVLT